LHANILLPALTSFIGFVFAGYLLLRFLRRRRPYQLAWTLGLLWYAIAAGTEALGGAFGWTPPLYRTWYATGAIGVAAYLGAGTVYLHREPGFGSLTVICILLASAPALAGGQLAVGFLGLAIGAILTTILFLRPRVFGHALFGMLLAASAAASVAVFSAPVDTSLLPASADQVVSGQAFGAHVRALTPPFNISGAAMLIFGAVFSAVHFWRTRSFPDRVASNVLIAVGAFIPSLASGVTRFGITSAFFSGELLGLLCIVAGFLLSASPSGRGISKLSRSSGGRRRCR
jgi:hypothetical protein